MNQELNKNFFASGVNAESVLMGTKKELVCHYILYSERANIREVQR